MRSAVGQSSSERRGESGFTLVELLIVLLIMSVVLAIAGTVLFSMSQTAARNDAMVQSEQKASTALAQVGRDIRSAHKISVPTGSTPANGLLLQVNQPSGSTVNVEWLYDSTKDTLTRYVQNGSGTYVASGPSASSVSNGAGGVFTYYNYSGANITSTDTGAPYLIVADCTTRITVQIDVSPSRAHVPVFQVSDDIALTDQLESILENGVSC